MPTHASASVGSRSLCEQLQRELRKSIATLQSGQAKDTCGLYEPGRNRFAYVYHRSGAEKIRVYFRGSRDAKPSDPNGRIAVEVRPNTDEGWDREFPYFIELHPGTDIAAAAAILISVAYPLSERSRGVEPKTGEQGHTADQYAAALKEIDPAPHHIRMLQAHYHATSHTLTATQLSKALGYATYHASNLHYGALGRLVAERIGWLPLPTQTVFVLATFQKPGDQWHWIMRPELVEALEALGWVGADVAKMPEEVDPAEPLFEGATRTVTVNSYERSAAAREKCILHHGCRCAACGMSLADVYGDVAQGLIHVHHLRQIADVGEEYEVDPINDLRPVCPNCHAVIHARKPPYAVEEIASMIRAKKPIAKG